MANTPTTDPEVKQFVHDWFIKLNSDCSAVRLLSLKESAFSGLLGKE